MKNLNKKSNVFVFFSVLSVFLCILLFTGFKADSDGIKTVLNNIAGEYSAKHFYNENANIVQTDFAGTLWQTGDNFPGGPRYYGGSSSYTRNDTSWMFLTGGDTSGSGHPSRRCFKYNFRTNQLTQIEQLPVPL